MLCVILADDEQYERNYLEKVIKESYPGLLEIVYKAVDGMDLMEKLEECKPPDCAFRHQDAPDERA